MVSSVSLLITTYNWCDALRQVLISVANQSHLPKEVVIADDGSDERTSAFIKDLKATFPTLLIHCWQEDDGFRAAAIRNKAISQITADYVVMIDGDMVLHRHFIKDHLASARQGYFIQGSRVITSPAAAKEILSGANDIHFFAKGISNRFNTINSPYLSPLFSVNDTSMKSTKTCNFSAWRDDLLRINGFNEDYVGWGREDSDLVARLFHSGKSRRRLKLLANAYHIYHPDNSRGRLSRNDQLLSHCLSVKQIRCDNGIDKYLSSAFKYNANTHKS